MIVAHASHWLVNLMFALPAVAFLGWLALIAIKDRRGTRATDDLRDEDTETE